MNLWISTSIQYSVIFDIDTYLYIVFVDIPMYILTVVRYISSGMIPNLYVINAIILLNERES